MQRDKKQFDCVLKAGQRRLGSNQARPRQRDTVGRRDICLLREQQIRWR